MLGNEPRHANGLGPRIPKLPSEFDLCTNDPHPLTRSSPCEATIWQAILVRMRRDNQDENPYLIQIVALQFESHFVENLSPRILNPCLAPYFVSILHIFKDLTRFKARIQLRDPSSVS